MCILLTFLLLWIDSITRAVYKGKHLIWVLRFQRVSSHHYHSRECDGRQGTGAVTKDSHLIHKLGMMRTLEPQNSTLSDTPSSTKPYLLILLSYFCQLWTKHSNVWEYGCEAFSFRWPQYLPIKLGENAHGLKIHAYIPPVKLTVYDLFSTHACILDCFQFLL